jgi:hypothetical protein
MEAIRMTMNSARLEGIIDLPLTMCDQDVDVIVLPSEVGCAKKSDEEKPKVESIMGILKEYANPAPVGTGRRGVGTCRRNGITAQHER